MKRGVRAVLTLGLAALTLFATWTGLGGAQRLGQTEEYLSLRLEGEGRTAGEFRSAMSEEETEDGAEYMAWGFEEGKSIQAEGDGKMAEGEVFYLCGNSRLLFWEEPFLDSQDEEGCLIGADLARALFGGVQVKGLKVQLQDRTYQVRGVIDKPVSWIVVRADEERKLDRVNARAVQGKTLEQTAQELTGRLGISGRELEWRLLHWGLAAGNLLLVTVLAAGLGRVLYRRRSSLTTWPLLLLMFLWLWFAGGRIGIPKELLPDRWSDFDFWVQVWEEKKEAVLTLLAAEKRGPELELVLEFFRTLCFQAAAGAGWMFLAGTLNRNIWSRICNFQTRPRQPKKNVL